MRDAYEVQKQLGEVDIAKIKFDPRSRDDIPRVLRGLQYVYTNRELRQAVFQLLEQQIAPTVDKAKGRPGMTLWKILVCGILRLDLNIDYDRLQELVNQHKVVRQMLEHGPYDDSDYGLQTLKDNVRLLTPKLLSDINQLIVASGHVLVKKKEGQVLRGRCDSFVVETDVHYPTDINLLFDAMRKVIGLTARLCEGYGITTWRQYAYNVRQLKNRMRSIQAKKRGQAKSPERKAERELALQKAHRQYLELAQSQLDKARKTLVQLTAKGLSATELVCKIEIEQFAQHAERQIDQTRRRVLNGEVIAHEEKVFSLFEPHTEWISKGKAGVPVELGVRVAVLEDQHRFILHHHVMEKQTDDAVAITMIQETQKCFPVLAACSFDKGFHSRTNQLELAQLLKQVALPRKGRLSKEAHAIEHSEDFVKARRKHAAVESAINALEVHGLDQCPDEGIDGFKRYVALAVVARNVHRIGDILKAQEQKRAKRKKREPDEKLLA